MLNQSGESMNRITVEKDKFKLGKNDFVALGFNYWHSDSPGSDPKGGDWSILCAYNMSTVQREVEAMASAGANTVRVWFAYNSEHWQNNTITDKALKNLRHFMQQCHKHGIYVIFTVGGCGSFWGVNRGLDDVFTLSPADIYVGSDIGKMFLEDVMELLSATGICNYENLLAIDLANEPIFAIPVTGKRANVGSAWQVAGINFESSLRTELVMSAWQSWAASNTDMGSHADTPKSEDFLSNAGNKRLANYYQQFVYDCFNRHTGLFARAIKSCYTNALVTIGFGCGGSGAEFAGGIESETFQILTLTQNVRQMQEGIDFICVHLYNGTNRSKMKFLREFVGSSKPILIEEFGYIPSSVDASTESECYSDTQEQKKLWEIILSGVFDFNYAGAIGCNYCDTNNSEPVRNSWSRMGIVTRTGCPKPAFDIFNRYALSNHKPKDFNPEACEYNCLDYRNDVELIGSLFRKKYCHI